MKDSALVSVLGYVELLKASQILITRTQEPFLILIVAGAFISRFHILFRVMPRTLKKVGHNDSNS